LNGERLPIKKAEYPIGIPLGFKTTDYPAFPVMAKNRHTSPVIEQLCSKRNALFSCLTITSMLANRIPPSIFLLFIGYHLEKNCQYIPLVPA
jgi:hypothetical protein